MISKSLVLIPAVIAVIALGAPRADAYIGFRLNLAVPLYYPTSGSPTTAVYQAPPAPVAEQVTTAPGPGYVWLAGHWSFYAQSWAWMAGHLEIKTVLAKYEAHVRSQLRNGQSNYVLRC